MHIVEHSWADPDLYVMADEGLIDDAENADFRICPMRKAPEPVLLPDQPWEGGDGEKPLGINQDPLDGTVLWDAEAEKFYCWYRSHNRLIRSIGGHTGGTLRPQGSRVCYAISRDGIEWEKPRVGLVAYENSFENNMVPVAQGPIQSNHLSGVVVNRVPGHEAPLAGTVHSRFRDPVYPVGITTLFSRDGLRWDPHWPPSLPIDGDAHCLMWDPNHDCYLCTTRSAAYTHTLGFLGKRGHEGLRQKRHVAIARSRDLVHWTPMMVVLEADEQDPHNAQLYMMYVIPYGHGYVGLLQLFCIGENWTYGPLEMQLAFGRNFLDWRRVGDRTPILPRGPQGAWDQAHTTICSNPPHPEGGRMRFWYGGKDTEHWQAGIGGMGTATLRRDGFACWEADEQGGVITTCPMEVHWSTHLFLNVEAPRGEVRAELIDAETREPIEGCAREDCQPVTGDHTCVLAPFSQRRGTFIRHTGQVRWRFHLRNARIYAFKAPNLRLEGATAQVDHAWL